MTHPDEHECFFRGCTVRVIGRYHCDRHEEVLEKRRTNNARRNSERATERRIESDLLKRGYRMRKYAAGYAVTKGRSIVPRDEASRDLNAAFWTLDQIRARFGVSGPQEEQVSPSSEYDPLEGVL